MFSKNPSLEEKFKLVADTIRSYPLQLQQAWEEVQHLYIPQDYKSVSNIVFCGMGGSALGARIVDSLTFTEIRLPMRIYNEYTLPNFANKNSLVIVSSYSGGTEETINATYDAIKRNAKIFGITTGGKLADILKSQNLPSYIFEPTKNPSKRPRMAIGYSSGAVLSLFSKLGFISVNQQNIEKTIALMNGLLTEYHENVHSEKNLAFEYAKKLKGKVPILISSEHLTGVTYTIKNQFNESAKTFCASFDIPEANHHLMEGLKNPARLRESFTFLFINSNLYSEKIQKRYPLTAEVVEKNGFDHIMYSPRSDDRLSQVFETLIFGSYVVYFLTSQYQIDPLAIPWVDYFKEKLSK